MYGSDVDYIVFFQLIFCICQLLFQNRKYNGGIQNTYYTNEWNSASWKTVYIVCQFPFIDFDKKITLLLLQKYFIQSMPVHKWPYYNSSKQKCYRKFYFDCESFTFLMIKNKLFFVSKFCVLFFARAKFGIYRSICIYH